MASACAHKEGETWNQGGKTWEGDRRAKKRCSVKQVGQGNWGGGNTENGGGAGEGESDSGLRLGNMGARLDKKGRGQKQGKGLGLCPQAERKSVGKEV